MLTNELQADVMDKLRAIYGSRAQSAMQKLEDVLAGHKKIPPSRKSYWDEKDIVLITYADILRSAGQTPLSTLNHFLRGWLAGIVNIVHILPFFPYSSDDGFSVIDYREVNPDYGTWDDVREIGERFDLMYDLVLNHVSARSKWAAAFAKDQEKYRDFFIAMDPSLDFSRVVRPRSLPLFTEFPTVNGNKHLWTTFSSDQLDLNFANPDVMLEMLDIFLMYIENGARIVRLDAIAYLWKELDTLCIHLPQTHLFVQLMRDILKVMAPETLILTETNVPHEENMSYLGNGRNEAHMVYQFTLPPLLLHTFLNEDATDLNRWASDLALPSNETTFLNFTASHDGIGVRPLEGIISREKVAHTVEEVKRRGGMVSTKHNQDGTQSPYELNISYFSALKDPEEKNDIRTIRRFLASQAIKFSLQGIPAVYFHNLMGTPNAIGLAEESGAPRSINRRKYNMDEFHDLLASPTSTASYIFAGMSGMMRARRKEKAFHPNVPQKILDLHPSIFAVQRNDVISMTNVSRHSLKVSLPGHEGRKAYDLISCEDVSLGSIHFHDYQARWIKLK